MAEESTPRRTTLAAVAAAAGVSVATVSKVVNGRRDVSAATRARVERLLDEHGYVARPAVRADGERRSVVLAFDALEVFNDLLLAQGVLEAAEEARAEVVVSLYPTGAEAAAWARRIIRAGRTGLVLVTSDLTPALRRRFAEARLPLVQIDPMNVPDESVPSVGSTNFAGGLAATEHLLGLGHRRIAVIEGRPPAMCSRARLHGYRAAFTGAGLEPDPALLRRPGDFSFRSGFRAAASLFALDEPPTAVFAASDNQALGVLEAARVAGVRVPHDVSVVGFDDSNAARTAAPPLTTVRQPFAEIGRTALRTLLAVADGEPGAGHRVELATRLVVRDSTAPAPAPS